MKPQPHPMMHRDALAHLDEDHRSLERLFGAWDALRGRFEARAEQAVIAERIVLELGVHKQVVERLFYPVLQRTENSDDGLAVVQAWAELALLDELRGQLASLTPMDEMFDPSVQFLAHLHGKHAQRERDCLFPLARRMRIDLVELGRRMAAESEWLLAQAAERGRARDNEEDDPVGRPVPDFVT